MFDSSHHIEHTTDPQQKVGTVQIDAPGTYIEDAEETELIAILESCGLDPQKLAGLPFEQAVEVLAQSEVSPEVLGNQQIVDYLTSLMGSDVRG